MQIQRNPLAKWCVADLARAIGTSLPTLERSFKQFYGITPQRYHARLRVARTAEAVRHETGSAEGVVMCAGWPNVDAFARPLRTLTGWRVSAIRERTADEFTAMLRSRLAVPVPRYGGDARRVARQP